MWLKQHFLSQKTNFYFYILINTTIYRIFISCYIITFLYPATSAALSIISMFVNHLHTILKTISSGMNIIKHGLIDKTPCFS